MRMHPDFLSRQQVFDQEYLSVIRRYPVGLDVHTYGRIKAMQDKLPAMIPDALERAVRHFGIKEPLSQEYLQILTVDVGSFRTIDLYFTIGSTSPHPDAADACGVLTSRLSGTVDSMDDSVTIDCYPVRSRGILAWEGRVLAETKQLFKSQESIAEKNEQRLESAGKQLLWFQGGLDEASAHYGRQLSMMVTLPGRTYLADWNESRLRQQAYLLGADALIHCSDKGRAFWITPVRFTDEQRKTE